MRDAEGARRECRRVYRRDRCHTHARVYRSNVRRYTLPTAHPPAIHLSILPRRHNPTPAQAPFPIPNSSPAYPSKSPRHHARLCHHAHTHTRTYKYTKTHTDPHPPILSHTDIARKTYITHTVRTHHATAHDTTRRHTTPQMPMSTHALTHAWLVPRRRGHRA